MATCRICKKYCDEEKMVKYGPRHYAHHRCYLDAGKPLSDLPAWKVRQFPYLLLKERGLLAEVEALTAQET